MAEPPRLSTASLTARSTWPTMWESGHAARCGHQIQQVVAAMRSFPVVTPDLRLVEPARLTNPIRGPQIDPLVCVHHRPARTAVERERRVGHQPPIRLSECLSHRCRQLMHRGNYALAAITPPPHAPWIVKGHFNLASLAREREVAEDYDQWTPDSIERRARNIAEWAGHDGPANQPGRTGRGRRRRDRGRGGVRRWRGRRGLGPACLWRSDASPRNR